MTKQKQGLLSTLEHALNIGLTVRHATQSNPDGGFQAWWMLEAQQFSCLIKTVFGLVKCSHLKVRATEQTQHFEVHFACAGCEAAKKTRAFQLISERLEFLFGLVLRYDSVNDIDSCGGINGNIDWTALFDCGCVRLTVRADIVGDNAV